MSNTLGLAGATSEKQTRFAPIWTNRFFSGIWTNRSPLRDANTQRIVEKFYGPSGDALIAGLNTEISNKLTLIRRPGVSGFNSHLYTAVDRFYSFRLFNITTEQIIVMIDEASSLLYLNNSGTPVTLFNKNATGGAGESYMQSVGNTLYFGDGVETRKWLQTLFTWTANTSLGTAAIPFLTTFLIDSNGFIQQLLGTAIPITGTDLTFSTTTGPSLTITSSATLSTLLSVGDIVTFPGTMTATWLENQSVQVLSITGTSMTVSYPLSKEAPTGTTTETATAIAINGGTPTTGATIPSFSTTVPSTGNNFQGGYTFDNSVVWVNRGNPLENWGIDNSKPTPLTVIGQPIILTNGPGSPITLDNILTYAQITAGNTGGTTISGPVYVLDTNNNVQYASSGTTGPAGANPNWSTGLGETTPDNTVTWTLVYLNAMTPTNGGWQYGVALVNSLDNTVSNIGPLSKPTGNFQSWGGVLVPPGAGIDSLSNIDPQSDYVAIFRTTDGQATPFLIPGVNGQTYTLPLSQYLANGYYDNIPDTGLNNLISAPLNKENTVPDAGAVNLVYHLSRIFYSVGNILKWTSGPDTPVGNGINGVSPLNFATLPSLITRLVPVASGLLVFTVSDVYILQGNGTTSSPLQGVIPLLPGIGLSSYNALDINGSLIGLFTTDSQFIILDPSSGTTYAGFPLGDQFRLDNGTPGQNWNPKNVYVAWHVQGEDQAWYVADGSNGWYRLMSTPAPESGYTWSPFADITVTGNVKVVQSVEVSPGVHRLLTGPQTAGPIFQRDLTVWTDNGVPYNSYAVIGSIVLCQPGQVAMVDHIVTDCTKVGTPINLGILVDDALPYYTGPIDILNNWINDPPNLPKSRSFWSQRFYLSELGIHETAAMRHMQLMVNFGQYDTVQNEMHSVTIFGTFGQEI